MRSSLTRLTLAEAQEDPTQRRTIQTGVEGSEQQRETVPTPAPVFTAGQ